MPEELKAQAEAKGINWEDAKKGLERLLPVIEKIARLTPNKFDDAAVELLKTLI